MYTPSQDWIEQIKFVIREMQQQNTFVLSGTVTSVDPGPPARVKVLLEPYEIESGWLPVASPYIGNGFGLILPPPEEGTPVQVIFDLGDVSNGTVIGATYNDEVRPPEIEPGAMGLLHKSGSYVTIGNDGTITIRGKNSTQSW